MSTLRVFFYGEIRNILCGYLLLPEAMYMKNLVLKSWFSCGGLDTSVFTIFILNTLACWLKFSADDILKYFS